MNLEKSEIEVTVSCGNIHSVTLATTVESNLSDPQSRAKLQSTVDHLLQSLPVVTIKQLDQDYQSQYDLATDDKGHLVLLPKGSVAAIIGQREMKHKIKPPEKPQDGHKDPQ